MFVLLLTTVEKSATTFSWPQIGIAGTLIGTLGALVGLAVRKIYSGDLVPRRTLEDAQEQRDKWEQASIKAQDNVALLAAQVSDLAEIGKVTESLLRSIVDDRKRNR